MNEARNEVDGSSTRKQAEKVKTQAREIVELLEEARKLMAEDNVVQPAMKHLCTALYEAESRAIVWRIGISEPTRQYWRVCT